MKKIFKMLSYWITDGDVNCLHLAVLMYAGCH